MSSIQNIVKITEHLFSKDVLRRIGKGFNYVRYKPSITIDEYEGKLITLGTSYGGWTFLDDAKLRNATIISCGLGEDASFDVEFARKYQARVIIVDPTPRAISHYSAIRKRFGRTAQAAYANGGNQPVEAYELAGLSDENFALCPKALWINSDKLKFYSPPNPMHVSHSIVNYLNNYSSETPYIEVDCITIVELLNYYGLQNIPLMKLDIEGAEIQVIADMLQNQIFPEQLLIEFDELAHPSNRSKSNFETTDALLRKNGYKLIDFNGVANFLYVRE